MSTAVTETDNPPTIPSSPGAGRASAEGGGTAANGAIPLIGYVCLCLSVFFFGYLFIIADPLTYHELRAEDRWIEDLTAVWFLLAGLLLFAAALFERGVFRRCVYILGGIVMVFIAGEEISWGQRIFGFATPDFLLEVNTQREFNVHNIDSTLTRDISLYAALMLCTITAAAFFRRKDALMGFPLPSLLTVFGFLIATAYVPDLNETPRPFEFFHLTVNFSNGRNLLLLFCFYFLLSRQVQGLAVSAASIALVVVFLYVYQPSAGWHGVRKEIEIQEYLFGLVCLFYALELLARRWSALGTRAPFANMQLRVAGMPLLRRIRDRPEWAQEASVYVCSLVLVCTIALALFSFLSDRVGVSVSEAIYRSVVSGAYGEPVGQSNWDVYLVEDRLIYFKEPCSRADYAPGFFLRVVPVDEDDLPDHRRPYGFDNWEFRFHSYGLGMMRRTSCIRAAPLPDYAISSIVTGQFQGGTRFWELKFSPPRSSAPMPAAWHPIGGRFAARTAARYLPRA